MGSAQPTGGGSTSLDLSGLQGLDSQGYRVLDALTPSDPPAGSFVPDTSHANPKRFVTITGETFWVKAMAQEG